MVSILVLSATEIYIQSIKWMNVHVQETFQSTFKLISIVRQVLYSDIPPAAYKSEDLIACSSLCDCSACQFKETNQATHSVMISAQKLHQFVNTNWFSTINCHGHISMNLQRVPLRCLNFLLGLFQGKLYLWVKTTSCPVTDNSCPWTSLNNAALQRNI
jgi:hypothetical protein